MLRLKGAEASSREVVMNGTSVGKALGQLWHRCTEAIAVDTEPHVWKTRDHGHIFWHAYDPNTGSLSDFTSENEVRVWLEERYYAH
jgi:hypothetical protein